VLAGAAPLLQRQQILFVLSECEPLVHTQRFVGFFALAEFLGGFGYRFFGVYEQQPEPEGNSLLYWSALFICEKLDSTKRRLGSCSKFWKRTAQSDPRYSIYSIRCAKGAGFNPGGIRLITGPSGKVLMTSRVGWSPG
jgi:hypothetical protein